MQMQSERLQEYIDRMSRDLVRDYSIPAEMYVNQDIKRGLRNNDGTGVLVGISKVGSVQGYYMVDGQRVPMPGKLYYRGISVEDIVDAHQQAGTFGYEEVAYLLLLGKLPTAEELAQFNQILAHARQMPAAFTEDMILKAPSRNIMNQLARSVLALYSFDDNADDTSPKNLLRQSIELIARFPLIAANAFPCPASSITAASASRILSRPIGKAARSAMRRSRICCCSALCPRRRSSNSLRRSARRFCKAAGSRAWMYCTCKPGQRCGTAAAQVLTQQKTPARNCGQTCSSCCIKRQWGR